jgi:hypothetical protein
VVSVTPMCVSFSLLSRERRSRKMISPRIKKKKKKKKEDKEKKGKKRKEGASQDGYKLALLCLYRGTKREREREITRRRMAILPRRFARVSFRKPTHAPVSVSPGFGVRQCVQTPLEQAVRVLRPRDVMAGGGPGGSGRK